MSWPDGERYLHLLQSLVVSLIYSSLFSDSRHTTSKFFDTHAPSICTEKLVLPRHARDVLSRLHCNGHSLLLSFCLISLGLAESRILPAAPADTSTPLISFCTVQLRTFCAARFLSLYDLWSRHWGVAQLLELHGLPPCPHFLEGGGLQQQQNIFLNSNKTRLVFVKK